MDSSTTQTKSTAPIEERGLRFNTGKVRFDLLEPYAIEQLAMVFTRGANKYADHNWLKGMDWSKVLASLERHINAFKNGEDLDVDPNCKECNEGTCKSHTGLLHMAHAAWNCMALVSYYKYHPELDDRIKNIIKPKRIGLDIDDVLASFLPKWCELHNVPLPTAWSFDRTIRDKFDEMSYNGKLNDFYLSLDVKTKPEDIPFEPVVYITSRPCASEITEQWLDMHGFPVAPVVTVGVEKSKLEAINEHKVDIFVDDNWNNFIEINQNGKCCFLFDALHNRRYNAGFRRIKSLKELL